jgi:hypothetical protein
VCASTNPSEDGTEVETESETIDGNDGIIFAIDYFDMPF